MKTLINNSVRSTASKRPRFAGGIQPCHRDDPWLAFGNAIRDMNDGQKLSGTGALVFEGELLERDRVYRRAMN